MKSLDKKEEWNSWIPRRHELAKALGATSCKDLGTIAYFDFDEPKAKDDLKSNRVEVN